MRETQTAKLYRRLLLAGAGVIALCHSTPLRAMAQGTKQWTVSRYDEFQRGTAEGVALRNDGRLEAGMAATTVYRATESYVWSVAKGPDGTILAGVGGSTGGSAAALRISANGSAEKVFAGKELGVQAIRAGAGGAIFAATSPDGKVYRLGNVPGGERVIFDPATTEERSKYIWDLAVASDGTVFVATGAPAAVYRIPAQSGKPELLFRTADAHIRSLLLSNAGVLWAGSDGSGVIYRCDTRIKGAKPFAAYASAHREITSLAMDGGGALYAAAVGAKSPGSLPPLPVTGATGVTVTFLQPGSASAAGSNGVVPDGSEIDRIAPNGTPQRLVALKDEVVYGLAMHGDQILAATGNRGRIYKLDSTMPGRFTEVARVEAGQATAISGDLTDLFVGTSNSGKVVWLQDRPLKAIYTSEVFDAGQYARWGRTEVQADAPGFTLSARSGNVPNTVQGWSDWVSVGANGETLSLLPGRYAQWRADLQKGAIASVTMNYLPSNVAPVIDEVVVVTGARVPVPAPVQQPPTVQITFASGSAAAQTISPPQQDAGSTPLTAQKDRSGVVVRWSAHDDNGDDLMFAVWYRGVGETRWRLLKDKLSDRFLSFDASLVPDGRYEMRVVASDGPVHTDADTLTGDRASAPFTVDTTPPVPGVLAARLDGGVVHWSFEARDAVSPISHAEFSFDAGPWQYVDPVGGLSDGLNERYEVRFPLPAKRETESAAGTQGTEHVLAVRVYDRADNMTSVKTVVR